MSGCSRSPASCRVLTTAPLPLPSLPRRRSWDDTLLPSTFVAHHRARPGGVCAEARRELALTGQSAHLLLVEALSLGQVAIVTNADEGWVENSAQKYMPAVLPLLRSGAVRVLSARRAFEQRWPAQPHLWKEAAFLAHLEAAFERQRERYGAGARVACRNVVSLGDSTDERYALWNALRKDSSVFGKSVKVNRLNRTRLCPRAYCTPFTTNALCLNLPAFARAFSTSLCRSACPRSCGSSTRTC